MELRKQELKKLTDLKCSYGLLTSINLTILKGGLQRNVVPAEMSATFDIRLSIDTDINEFEQRVRVYSFLIEQI